MISTVGPFDQQAGAATIPPVAGGIELPRPPSVRPRPADPTHPLPPITDTLAGGLRALLAPPLSVVGGAFWAFHPIRQRHEIPSLLVRAELEARTLTEPQSPAFIRPTPDPTLEREMTPYVALLQRLLDVEAIPSARHTLEALPLRLLETPPLARIRRALPPPAVRKVPRRGGDRDAEFRWLRQNAAAYKGRWVAILQGRLLASAASLKDLRRQLEALRPEVQPLIHKVE